MALRKDRIQLDVEINGQKAGKTYKELTANARNLKRELRNLVPGTDAFVKKAGELKKVNTQLANIRTQTKGVQKGMNSMRTSLTRALPTVIAFFAVDRIVDWGKALFKVGVQGDALARKAETVLGPALGSVQQKAEDVAVTMGLTTQEYVSQATAIADLLIPMGFQRQESADLSTELVDLSGALSEWSGGQKTATEVSEILGKAILGEREQLKTLGIAISEADVKARLQAKGLDVLTGKTLAQAKASVTLELITEKSADAQAAFAANTDTAIRRQAELSAKIKEVGERIAKLLLPVFERLIGLGDKVADFAEKVAAGLERLIDPSKALTDQFDEQTKKVANLEDELVPLLERYEELQAKAQPTAAEQKELGDVIKRIGEITPTAIREVDNYGNALRISAGASREFLEEERKRLAFVNAEAIAALEKQIGKMEEQRAEMKKVVETGFLYADTIFQRALSPELLADRADKMDTLTKSIEGARLEMERLTGANLGGEEDNGTGGPLGTFIVPLIELPEVPEGEGESSSGASSSQVDEDANQKAFEKRLADLEEGFERENLIITQQRIKKEIDDLEFGIQTGDAEKEFLQRKLNLLTEFGLQESNIYLETQNKLFELQQERNVEEIEFLRTSQEPLQSLFQIFQEKLTEIQEEESDKRIKQNEKEKKSNEELFRESLQNYAGYANQLIDIINSNEASKDKIGKKAKRREIASVTLAGTAEIAQIWANAQKSPAAQLFGPLAGTALALVQTGFAVARTKNRISAIEAQQFAEGGRVLPFFSGRRVRGRNIPQQANGDNVLATLRVNEVVLNEEQQARIGGSRALRDAGVPGFAGGGLVTVDTTPQIQNIDIGRPQSDSQTDPALLQEVRGLRGDIQGLSGRLKAEIKYSDLEDAESKITEIRDLANV